MKPEQRHALMFRWSLFLTAVVIIAWFIYWRAAGSIPTIKDLSIVTHLGDAFNLGHLVINLPWAIPRWVLDAPFVFAWTIIVISCLTHPRITGVNEGRYHWLAGLIIGLIIGAPCALMEEMSLGLGFALAYAIGTGLVFIFPHSLGFCIGFGLSFGAAIGLGFGLVGLAVTGAGLLIGPPIRVAGIYMFSPAPWVAIGRWLMARDKE
ncbi:MAG: hypothetical protein AAB568_04460 [Patescibacteria group bacterium]